MAGTSGPASSQRGSPWIQALEPSAHSASAHPATTPDIISTDLNAGLTGPFVSSSASASRLEPVSSQAGPHAVEAMSGAISPGHAGAVNRPISSQSTYNAGSNRQAGSAQASVALPLGSPGGERGAEPDSQAELAGSDGSARRSGSADPELAGMTVISLQDSPRPTNADSQDSDSLQSMQAEAMAQPHARSYIMDQATRDAIQSQVHLPAVDSRPAEGTLQAITIIDGARAGSHEEINSGAVGGRVPQLMAAALQAAVSDPQAAAGHLHGHSEQAQQPVALATSVAGSGAEGRTQRASLAVATDSAEISPRMHHPEAWQPDTPGSSEGVAGTSEDQVRRKAQ